MKLESIKTYVVGNPPPSFGGRYFVFVKIRTACGIEGVGVGVRSCIATLQNKT